MIMQNPNQIRNVINSISETLFDYELLYINENPLIKIDSTTKIKKNNRKKTIKL